MLVCRFGPHLTPLPVRIACVVGAATVLVAGCSTPPKTVRSEASSKAPVVASGALPRIEPIRPATTRPYTVLGRTYFPMSDFAPYEEEGIASWYGREFHGKPTATGERFDMFAMTAAHKTLPLPSYARVTSLTTGRQVIVRVNDRGPFVGERLIDLSFAAADALGIANQGTAPVRVSLILPDEIREAERQGRTILAEASPTGGEMGHDRAAAASAGSSPDAPPSVAKGATRSSAGVGAEVSLSAAAVPLAAPAVSAPVPAAQEHGAGGRFFLQLGAFSVPENAENFAAHLRAVLPEVALRVVRQGGLVRVVAGPYRNETVAHLMAEQLLERLGHSPLVVRAEALGGLP